MDRKADPETQLMIDEAILDYLLYTAIKALLEAPEASISTDDSAQLPIQMVGSFLAMFRVLHPDHQPPAETQFRLRLLQFSYVFKRCRRYPSPLCSPIIAKPQLLRQMKDSKHHVPATFVEKREELVDLRDTLPLFLALSAIQNSLQESTITELWMRLAAGYMAQAYLEQALLHDGDTSGLLEDIFHWGYDPSCSAKKGSDEWKINGMFGADDDIRTLWDDIKQEHVSALHPPTGKLLIEHLDSMLRNGFSIVAFDEKVTEFLNGLHSAHPPPLLRQLESGNVTGLSRTSTAALKSRAGFL
ncbi:MAG: hypothetical protein Q9170_002543 [Blastenia crenularia]